MASVALCPRCSHDLLVPDGTDSDAWAQCSACNVLFQVRDAISRDVAELKLVEPVPALDKAEHAEATPESKHDELQLTRPTPTIAISSQKTLGEIETRGGSGQDALLDVTIGDEAEPTNLPRRSAPTIDDLAKSSAPTWEDSPAELDGPHSEIEPPAEPDVDLASARTVAEIPDPTAFSPVSESARAGATIEFSGDPADETNADFELEGSPISSLPAEPLAPWDDSEHMERLLNGDGVQPAKDAPSFNIPPGAEEAVSFDRPIIDPELLTGPVGPRRRRQRSAVRMLTGIVLSGIVGLALGYIILLWLLGPSTDFLGIAQYLPSVVVPTSFHSAPIHVAHEPTTSIDTHTKPAGFDTPTTSGKSMVDDVTALQTAEPSKFEPSEATPLNGDDATHVGDAPAYSSDELAGSLKTAQHARAGLIEGDLADGKEVQHAKGYSYSVLCELADRETFVDTSARPDFVAAMRQAADDLFRTTLANAHTRREVARIVPLWIGSKSRKHAGVFFAGTIDSQVGRGTVVECRVNLGAGEPLTLLLPKSRSSELDNVTGLVAVVGSIVDSPAQKVTGYDGDATQAIWVGRLIPLN